jgi:hypothetical protein
VAAKQVTKSNKLFIYEALNTALVGEEASSDICMAHLGVEEVFVDPRANKSFQYA